MLYSIRHYLCIFVCLRLVEKSIRFVKHIQWFYHLSCSVSLSLFFLCVDKWNWTIAIEIIMCKCAYEITFYAFYSWCFLNNAKSFSMIHWFDIYFFFVCTINSNWWICECDSSIPDWIWHHRKKKKNLNDDDAFVNGMKTYWTLLNPWTSKLIGYPCNPL